MCLDSWETLLLLLLNVWKYLTLGFRPKEENDYLRIQAYFHVTKQNTVQEMLDDVCRFSCL